MKIQELAIVFIIIILPISLLLSEYTQFQIKTLNTQSMYDAKLTSATYDAIKAFQMNATNSTTSDQANSKMRDLEASVASFKNSIKSAFELTGYEDDDLNSYIPALVYTLYDGFYIYSPYENINYRYEIDDNGNILYDKPIDNNGEKLYGLKPYINYSCRYKKSNIDVVITYSLDNYIKVQGIINNKYVNKSGYLIDGIEIIGDTVKYNGVTIGEERLRENINGKDLNYAKINGTKYYLSTYKDKDGFDKECIIYFLNGRQEIQYKEGEEQFISWKSLILNNDSAVQYYKEAKQFTDWVRSTSLSTLKCADAIDEVIKDDGTIESQKISPGNNKKIFGDISNNIENKSSNFNQHRLAVIRHKIETNLAIAISNYNDYAGAADSNVFQMPELKEDEWNHITRKISLISFLQGLPIGGKIYNGYSLVTNAESEEVVLEENIYILGYDNVNSKYSYHKIGDKGLESGGSIDIKDNKYGYAQSAGRLNVDFERMTVNSGEVQTYNYPLKDYDASYDSIVMQNNVTTYDDIYTYVNEQSYKLKTAFYTALGRERYSMYKPENSNKLYSVLVIGMTRNSEHNAYAEQRTVDIANVLNELDGVRVKYKFYNASSNNSEVETYVEKEKNNYNLIIFNGFAWNLKIGNDKLQEIAKTTNIITISEDAHNLPMIYETLPYRSYTYTTDITKEGKDNLTDIKIFSNGSNRQQRAVRFKEDVTGNGFDDVEVFYKGREYKDIDGNKYEGEYDLIGCCKLNNKKWIHSQIALGHNKLENNKDEKELLKALTSYALSEY